jgi:hypothetical protein
VLGVEVFVVCMKDMIELPVAWLLSIPELNEEEQMI